MNRWISENSPEICRSARHWIYSSPSCGGIIWYKWWHTACWTWTSLAKVKDGPMPFMDFSFRDGGDRSRMDRFSLFVSRIHGECLGARTCQGESEDETGNRKPALRHSEVLWDNRLRTCVTEPLLQSHPVCPKPEFHRGSPRPVALFWQEDDWGTTRTATGSNWAFFLFFPLIFVEA